MRIFSKIYIVSHSRERSEKTCLNCNAQLHGKFCHVCGQENTDPRESLWSIVTHFFNDITHFDGKFFTTAGKLLAKPGFLPSEFIKGRRARYLHPIRLYVFTSAIFFLIFYSFISPSLNKKGVSKDSSLTIGASNRPLNPIDTIFAFTKREKPYKTVAEYDSIERTLPAKARDGWLIRKLTERNIERMNRYSGRNDMMFNGIISNFIHSFPYLLFVSLPISAFFLQILYFRNKNSLYAGHTIFLVYLYVFTFLISLVFFGLEGLRSTYPVPGIGVIEFLLTAYLTVYSLVAMKNYYAEGWGLTTFKFIVFNVLAFFSLIGLFVVFFLLSLFKV